MIRSTIVFGLAAVACGLTSTPAKAQIGIGVGRVRVSVGRPRIHRYVPSYPVHVGPTHVVGYNPWTGAVNTHNTQVNNTAFDPGRDASRFNGTARNVSRPIYDAYGRIVGWEQGTVWQNSHTGQWHGDTTVHRPNGTGGTSSTNVIRSAAPPASGTDGARTVYGAKAKKS